jgi:3-hydroxyisobutyrate dehydrogenase-like beta-hydroxyacid dehydrogenase
MEERAAGAGRVIRGERAMEGVVGFIGLGNMGGPMATNLAKAGTALCVYDVAPPAMAALTALPGVSGADSAGAVAERARVLFTVLPNDEIVKAAYLGAGGIAGRGRAGLITCNCSTVSPEATQAVHAGLQACGIGHLDTPMLGSRPQALSGEVFFIVGGDAALLPDVAPLLDAMGKQHIHVGPSSAANRIKLIHNVLGALNSVAAAESLALCVQAGVDAEVYRRVVVEGSGMAYTTYFGKRAERVLDGDYSTQFSLALMHKDVTLALAMAQRSGTRLPLLEATRAAYAEAMAGGWGGEDFSAVTHVIEGRIGRPLRRRRAGAKGAAG